MPDHSGSERSRIRHARGSYGQEPDDGIARHLGELAREMEADPTTTVLLRHIVDAVAIEIPGADHAGISLLEGKHIRSPAATDEISARLDERQQQLMQGPCITTLRDETTVLVSDFDNDARWPQFAATASEHGVRSMLSVQLFVEGDNLGSLNLYSTRPAAFSKGDESDAMLLAAHAAVAMKASRVEDHLREAMQSRDVIGQAKGILMERYKIDASQAFDVLISASQRSNRKLRTVADELAATGEMSMD